MTHNHPNRHLKSASINANKGFIKNPDNIPVDPWRHNKADKRITLQIDDYINKPYLFECSTSIPNIDFCDSHGLDTKDINKYN